MRPKSRRQKFGELLWDLLDYDLPLGRSSIMNSVHAKDDKALMKSLIEQGENQGRLKQVKRDRFIKINITGSRNQ